MLVALGKKIGVLAVSAAMLGLSAPAQAVPVQERQRHQGGLNIGAVLIGAAVLGGAFLLSRTLRKSGGSSDVAERQREMQRVDRERRQQANGACATQTQWQGKGSLPTITNYADSRCGQLANTNTNVSFVGL